MKFVKNLFAIVLLCGLSACSTPINRSNEDRSSAPHPPWPVLWIYHVKPGAEKDLQELIERAWEIYQKEHLVLNQPHICVLIQEDSNHFQFIEIFVWGGPFAIEYPSESVKHIWNQMRSLCEKRQGGRKIEMQDAEILAPQKYGFYHDR